MNGIHAVSSSPPRAPPIKYPAPLGTRWAKETAAAGGVGAFDLPTDPKSVGPWILGECVGKGASGRVKIAKHRLTGQLAAVKILPIAPIHSSRTSLTTQQEKFDKQRLGIDREITMMKLMNHPNIIRIYDVFEGEKELYLILEYVEGGELFDFLVNRGRLPSQEALAYFKQIVYGLRYAHRFSIIHRDLKPENILISTISPPLIKIADWGMAAFAPPTLELVTSCGSPHYASPEIVNGEAYQGNATDIWSCGVILYALLTGRLPFDDKNVKTLLSKVKSGKYEMPSWIDSQAKDLLSKMLVVNVKERITIEQILRHPWFTASSSSPEEKALETSLAGLAPSPSTLARPLPSPSHIDPELLASLRIIWGRHDESGGELIKADLCSPVGQGVYAKAFYYLLNQHRQETTDADSSEHEIAAEQLAFHSQIDFLTVASARQSRAALDANRDPSESVARPLRFNPLVRRSSLFANTTPTSTRERTSVPAGPREYPNGRPGMEIWRTYMQHTAAQNSAQTAETDNRGSRTRSRIPPRRGYTYSHPTDVDFGVSTVHFPAATVSQEHAFAIRPRSSIGGPDPNNDRRNNIVRYSVDRMPFGPAAPPTSEAPRDTLSRRSSIKVKDGGSYYFRGTGGNNRGQPGERNIAGDSPPRSSIPVDGVDPKSTSPTKPTPAQGRQSKRVSRSVDLANKENSGMEEGWTRVNLDNRGLRGLGLGVGREIGKNVGNVLPTVGNGQKEKKDKKNRPPTLDFRNLNLGQGRPSALASPIQLSTPVTASSASTKLVTSPVVGEFREWFQSLFSWKTPSNQGGALYSFSNISQTRADTLRLLQDAGVLVENELPTYVGDVDISAFRCRINDTGNGWSSPNSLRSCKFRVEFCLAPRTGNPDDVDGRITNPHLLNAPSPIIPTTPALSAPPLRSRHSILLSRRSLTTQANSPKLTEQTEFPPGAECAVVMVYEKGSVTTFKAVWRVLREAYDVGNFNTSSPAMNTPVAEQPQEILV